MGMKINSKSSKPHNILEKEYYMMKKCEELEIQFPAFFRDYFIFLKGSVSISSRYAYLIDIYSFFEYLITTKFFGTEYVSVKQIKQSDLKNITAREINYYIGEYCRKYEVKKEDTVVIFENQNKSLSRKKSSLTSLFKFFFRNEQMKHNLIDGFNPIKMPKLNPDAIKRLSIDETNELIHVINTGIGLTNHEKIYWEKTKYRDKAIIMIFITLGLRLSELEQLNITSINFKRKEILVFRKRGKEVLMPFNDTIEHSILQYINLERNHIIINDENDPLFLSLQGKRMTGRQIRQMIKKYTSIVLGDNEGFSPHKLRSTLASSLIERGFSIYDVQNLLDHDNVTTTQIYASHKKNVKKNIIENIDYIEDESEEKQ